ncbi:MAG: hypothetical protein WC742_12605 [Gallionellaceae bacterium]|jgi:hypothetical protein
MGNDNRPEIVLDGDISPFRQKMREAGNDLKKLGSEGEQAVGRMTGPLNALQSKFVAIGALLAGGSVFKEAIAQTVKLNEESIKLGRALNISAGDASILREALTAGNTSQEEFVAAAKGLSKELINNESGLQAMGLATRDASGNLRPLNDLVLDGIGVLNNYRAGTDRVIAGQAMFGKGFEMTSNLAEMNKQAVADVAQQMRDLGLVVSEENVAAYKAFDDAGDSASLTLLAVKTTIGNALMPVLTKLAEWFSIIGPAAVVVIRGSLNGLITGFWLFKNIVSLAWETINAMVVTVAEPLRMLASILMKIGTGDFSGAWNEYQNGVQTVANAWKGALTEIEKSHKETRKKIIDMWSEGTPTAKPGTSGKGAGSLLKPKAEPEKSHMAEYDAQLAAKKNLFEQENQLRQYSKEQELAYWRELQQGNTLTNSDRLAIAKRTAALELEIRRASAKEQRDLDAATVDSRRAASLAQIQQEEQQANFARANGTITQTELIALEEEFARRRFEIEQQSLIQRLEAAQNDPNTSPAALMRIKEQQLEIERQYLLRRGELHQKSVIESEALWNSLGDRFSSLWDKGINAMMNGTLTWANATKAVGADMAAWFVVDVIGKEVKEWISSRAKILATKLGFIAAEKTAEAGASTTTVAIKATETAAVVGANAAQAGSGAAAAVAPTPFVGPILALAAMATVFGAVMAMSSRKSAAKGYDIPKGLNPVTQLHEEEMVLPSKFANVIRDMAEGSAGGQGGGSTTTNTYHISTFDSKSFERFAHENKRIFAGAVKSAGRDGFK